MTRPYSDREKYRLNRQRRRENDLPLLQLQGGEALRPRALPGISVDAAARGGTVAGAKEGPGAGERCSADGDGAHSKVAKKELALVLSCLGRR